MIGNWEVNFRLLVIRQALVNAARLRADLLQHFSVAKMPFVWLDGSSPLEDDQKVGIFRYSEGVRDKAVRKTIASQGGSRHGR
jgi:hypothetical protein